MAHYNAAVAKLDIPSRMRSLPIDDRGFPVPKFVMWIDGKPDFRCVDGRYLQKAVTRRLCWLCGGVLGRHLAFVLGPMCAINRVSSEPPCHLDCARFAAQACPFLTQPKRIRNEHDLPEEHVPAAGVAIARNPGVTAIWITNSYQVFKAEGVKHGGMDGALIHVGPMREIEWWARGRRATRAEILESLETGLPILRDMARKEGRPAEIELDKQVVQAMALVPAE